MTQEEIERLIGQAERVGGEVFEYMEDGATLVLRKTSPRVALEADRGAVAVSECKTTSHVKTITAPATGVFLDRHPLAKSRSMAPEPYVAKGMIVGFLKVDSVLRLVLAPMDCVIERSLVANGTLVGFGTPLYALAGLKR